LEVQAIKFFFRKKIFKMKVKWLKFHPLSACSVGDTEEIKDEERRKALIADKYVCPIEEKAQKPK
jgi:hypothetical protein